MEAESRLQKRLAAAGLGSRRDIEALIRAGRVTVNGEPAVLGMRVGPDDALCIDGQPCAQPAARAVGTRVIGLHKPADVVCTADDPEGRATIFDLLPPTARRWVMVGRLDLTTSGLVLFTDDGELAHRLTHPSYEIPRRYAVRVLGTPTPEDLRSMQRGVEVDGELLKFDRVVAAGGDGANRWFDCTLHTGRNREVRRLWEAHGFAVSRLMRTSYGPLGLPREVRPGGWFEVTGDALIRLYEAVALASPSEPRDVLSGARLVGKRGRRTPGESAATEASTVPRRKQRAQDRTARVEYVPPGEKGPRGRRTGDAGRFSGADDARPARARRGPPPGRQGDAAGTRAERPSRGGLRTAPAEGASGHFRSGEGRVSRQAAFHPGTERPGRPPRSGQTAQRSRQEERPRRARDDQQGSRPPREGQRGRSQGNQTAPRPWSGARTQPEEAGARARGPRDESRREGPWSKTSGRQGGAPARERQPYESARSGGPRQDGRRSQATGTRQSRTSGAIDGRARTPGVPGRSRREGGEAGAQRPWETRSAGSQRRSGPDATGRSSGPARSGGTRAAGGPPWGERNRSGAARSGPRGTDASSSRGPGGPRGAGGPGRPGGSRPPGRPRGGTSRRPN